MNVFDDTRIAKSIEWLKDQVNDAGAKGLVVGISGGIDSAVVANLIKRAYPDNSMGLILPISSQQKDVIDGIAVAEAASLQYQIIDFSEIHRTMINKVTDVLQKTGPVTEHYQKISDANLRARLRMSTIYAVANAMNYLVVGTDNAAEVYTGYFTKYGDGGVDLLPIAGLLKSEVYRWAEELGVPKQIIERAPSAGLWEGQTDEDEMGVTYEIIDQFLEGKMIPEKEKMIIQSMHEKTRHKRQMPPMPEW
ncbi:NAD(+) synthase [Anoxynatronum buryatiense]|uniref:NH(3)-dependent NAD(+) synthetase n=1 Tax=Anoxynatronum buryatiense TaxID=489973 RepID=A0AA45WUZ7_9CLOT|nr:NAD(+) synthase [Anoxynatronum buryatiense]SMP49834.1 NH(3)-dependent NAD(+) synthetase [Anoxynatronum buryatiense]